jgi:hypothetical protein
MRYEFECTDCKAIQEVVVPMSQAKFDDRPCPYCKGTAKYKLGAPGLMTSSMTHQTVDVLVGKDAEARWSDIYRRQELREKVRKESNQTGISMTGRNEFKPLSKNKNTVRTEASRQAEKAGEYSKERQQELSH